MYLLEAKTRESAWSDLMSLALGLQSRWICPLYALLASFYSTRSWRLTGEFILVAFASFAFSSSARWSLIHLTATPGPGTQGGKNCVTLFGRVHFATCFKIVQPVDLKKSTVFDWLACTLVQILICSSSIVDIVEPKEKMTWDFILCTAGVLSCDL